MADVLLLLVAFVAVLAAVAFGVSIAWRAKRRRAVSQRTRALREQQDRDATVAYLGEVGKATTLTELERLAEAERKRQDKWDGS